MECALAHFENPVFMGFMTKITLPNTCSCFGRGMPGNSYGGELSHPQNRGELSVAALHDLCAGSFMPCIVLRNTRQKYGVNYVF
jgi:hypothetical protein